MEGKMISKFSCGCEIWQGGGSEPGNFYAIHYCSKHKAAPDMYEALVEFLDDEFRGASRQVMDKIWAAKHKAEGKD